MIDLSDRLPEWMEQAIEAHREGDQLVFLFDFDGTLAPIVRHPSLAHLPDATRQALQRLSRLPRVAIGIVSGRPLNDLLSRVGIDGAWYAGSGGMELILDQRRIAHPRTEDFESVLERVHDQLAPIVERSSGGWIERKPAAMTIHYRNMLPLDAVCLRLELFHVLTDVPDVHGRIVSEAIEVMPAHGWHKGDAVQAMLRHAQAKNVQPTIGLYFGDAANDTEAMQAIHELGGITVGIGSEAPLIAQRTLDGPEQLQQHLTELVHLLELQSDEAPEHWPGVLIVDPCPTDRDRLAVNLRKRGWRTCSTGSVVEARDLARSLGSKLQVALVDYEMPGMLGSRFINQLRQEFPGLIACGMAHVSPYVANVYKRLTRTTLFNKPVAIDRIDRALRDMLGRPSQHESMGEAIPVETSWRNETASS